MNKSNCQYIGKLSKTHGVSGSLIFRTQYRLKEAFGKTELIRIDIDGGLVPFFIQKNGIVLRDQHTAVLSIEDIDNKATAQKYINAPVYLDRELMNEVITSDSIDYNTLIGFEVSDENKGRIGQIHEVIGFKNNPVMKVLLKGKEILIPLNEDIIIEIDEEKKIIHIHAPDGLISMYIDSQ